MVVRASKKRCPICGGIMAQKSKICWECRKKRLKRICPVCGKEFEYKASTNKKTCSLKCSYILRGREQSQRLSQKIVKTCIHCGKEFEVPPSKENHKFCSLKCHYAYHTGENSISWKGGVTPERASLYSSPEWKAIVPKVWEREDATCQRCGSKYTHDMKTYEIHHIIPFVYEDYRLDIDNLALLCYDCHRWVHSKKNTNQEFIKEPLKEVDEFKD